MSPQTYLGFTDLWWLACRPQRDAKGSLSLIYPRRHLNVQVCPKLDVPRGYTPLTGYARFLSSRPPCENYRQVTLIGTPYRRSPNTCDSVHRPPKSFKFHWHRVESAETPQRRKHNTPTACVRQHFIQSKGAFRDWFHLKIYFLSQ